MEKEAFFKENVVYQIYPRSFYDSNGDGIGDLKGIISKLDYLRTLGVGIIWLSPVYPSPNVDYGYDISNYTAINPEFGTMEDMDCLIAEAKKRGLRIVMDLVINHTSDKHPWFLASKDPSSPYHDYYIWRKGKKDNTEPPNNWTSNFTGSAWKYVPEVKEWYLHLFTENQPDLNWKNPKVLEEIEKILRFWLDKGVYGFRCDVINQIYKTSLVDGKKAAKGSAIGAEHFLNQEGNHKILHRFYEDIFSHYDSMTVGETADIDYEQGRRFTSEELDMVFEFQHIRTKQSPFIPFLLVHFQPEKWKQILIAWQKNLPWNANYLENHDQPRSVARFGNAKRYYLESGKMLAMLNLFLRGTPFIFEGEEIGMKDYPKIDWSKTKDIVPLNLRKLFKSYHLPLWVGNKLYMLYDRDNSRMPMRWDDGIYSGFSSHEPWLPVDTTQKGISVAAEKNDPNSMLSFYKKAIACRKSHSILSYGKIEFLDAPKGVMVFKRGEGDNTLIVILNLTKKKRRLLKPIQGKVLLSSLDDLSLKREISSLRPYEGLVVKPE